MYSNILQFLKLNHWVSFDGNGRLTGYYIKLNEHFRIRSVPVSVV